MVYIFLRSTIWPEKGIALKNLVLFGKFSKNFRKKYQIWFGKHLHFLDNYVILGMQEYVRGMSRGVAMLFLVISPARIGL